ncbi:hypothetical protein [Kamptonema formosum]|uniref:hypothetical protein n=1 Tax=Kamptonema formosum TaxID=331992 RepID=UPI0012DE8F76|nr:hypothetical protein [Oscillatoria sp. PCC 10802]
MTDLSGGRRRAISGAHESAGCCDGEGAWGDASSSSAVRLGLVGLRTVCEGKHSLK